MTRLITPTRRLLLGGAAVTLAAPAMVSGQENPIRIGFPVPLTGPFGAEAQDQVRAAEVAIAEFNGAGGLGGRRAELLVRDDRLNPGEAATRTLELIERDRADFIVGGLSAAVQLAINNVTKQRRVLFNSISQSDTINEASDWSRYTFHEALNPHMTAGAVARYAVPKYGKRWVFLIADYAYGHEMLRGFQRAGRELGLETLADIRHPFGATDYSTFMPRIAAARPDVLCLVNFGRDQQIAVRQATDFGIKRTTRIVAPVLLYTARLAGGGPAFEGVVGGTSYYWRMEESVPSAKAFNDKFRAQHGNRVPSDYGALGYGGVRTVLESVKAAGSVETERVVEAMRALRHDFYKGPQYYRGCDHQSVQSVLVLESKANTVRGEADVFDIVATEGPDERYLRSCSELGHG